MVRFILESWKRFRSTTHRDAVETRLNEEIRFHLDQQMKKNLRAGMSPDEARRAALLKLGSLETVTEGVRDESRATLLEDAMRDLRHGVRLLGRARGFTAAILLTLALGIGATATIFSVVRAVILKPLPYDRPEEVVAVWETTRGGGSRNVIAPFNFVAWREQTKTLEHLGMVEPAGLAMLINGQPLRASGLTLSADVFLALRVQPMIGRVYTVEEDARNSGVIVLSHEMWQRLGGLPDVLGSSLSTEAGPKTIIGVMPSGFTVVGRKADFLIPFGQTPDQLRAVRGRGSAYAIARLRNGVSLEQAQTEMRGIFAQLEKEAPQLNAQRTAMLIPVQEQMVGDLRPAVVALVGSVLLLLLVACVNVANLLLARGAARAHEVGLRAALGAKRGRLVRQLLSESLVLAIAGGFAGLVVTVGFHRGLLALVSDRIPIPRLDQAQLDTTTIVFTMAIALATGLLFGIFPAVVATGDVGNALREGGRQAGSRRLRNALNTLVVGEVALSLVLLAGAGLLMRSFIKLQSVDPGFLTQDILTVSVQLPATRYDAARGERFFADASSRMTVLPGIQSVAAASCMPVPYPCIGTSFWRADRPTPKAGQLPSAHVRPVSAGFFRTLGIPEFAGRDFSDSDTAESTPVAIVSDELVRQQYDGANPIGRRLRVDFDHANGRDDVEWTIVGVVGNIRSQLDGPVRQTIYVPRTQRPNIAMTFFIRAQRDPAPLIPSVTAIIHSMEPEAPIQARTLDDVLETTIARPRTFAVLVGAFATLALALAAVGVYGVMAYSVRERTQEIGVRMALGASTSSVLRLVLGQTLRLLFFGVTAGLVAAAMLTPLLERLLFGVRPVDPATFLATVLLLIVVATFASYVPARRAMRLDPAHILRAN